MEISVIYFKFHVVSNIAISMPGKEMIKSLNICLPASAAMNNTRMNETIQEYLKTYESLYDVMIPEFREHVLKQRKWQETFPALDTCEKDGNVHEWDFDCDQDRDILAYKTFTISDLLYVTSDFEEIFFTVFEVRSIKFIFQDLVCYNLRDMDHKEFISFDWDVNSAEGNKPLHIRDFNVRKRRRGLVGEICCEVSNFP